MDKKRTPFGVLFFAAGADCTLRQMPQMCILNVDEKRRKEAASIEFDKIKLLKRTVGLLLLLVLLTGTFAGLLWFFGNPLERMQVNKHAAQYTTAQYPQGWKAEKANFILADRAYRVKIFRAGEVDDFFYLTYQDGDLQWDSYEADVLQKGNTIRRLQGAYTELMQKLVDTNELLAGFRISVQMDPEQTDLLFHGMDFSPEDELSYHLFLSGSAQQLTPAQAAKYFEALDEISARKDYRFSFYSLDLSGEEGQLTFAQVVPEQVRAGNLDWVLEAALNQDGSAGIYGRLHLHDASTAQ